MPSAPYAGSGPYPEPAQYAESSRSPESGHAEPPRYPEGPPYPADYAEPGQYAAAGDYGNAGAYQDAGGYGDPGGYGDSESYGDPGIYGRPAGYEEPGTSLQPAAGQSVSSHGDQEDYSDFWKPEPHGAAPGKRPTGFLIAVAAAIVAAGAVAAVLLLMHHGPARHPAAGSPPIPTAARTPVSSPAPSTTTKLPPAPPLTGANGQLGVPRQIGTLLLNPSLTQRFVGRPVQRQDANSFFIPVRDVVSGFYTANPSVTTFTARDPRLMFLVAYLHGTGNPASALHAFLTNHTFTGQQRVSPGPLGGEAACGLLPQQPSPVAHCMWADGNTYADFYAWDSSPSALAQTMIAIRPKVELGRP
jgi:hypothetical protein